MNRMALLLKDPKVFGVIANPHIRRAPKRKTITDLVVKEKFSPITANFVTLLAEIGRLPSAADIVSSFAKIMNAYRGEVLCSVTTASSLDKASLTELKSALNGFLAKGEILKPETKTDTTILGGMIVGVGDKYVDMSIKTKIQKLTKVMKGTVCYSV